MYTKTLVKDVAFVDEQGVEFLLKYFIVSKEVSNETACSRKKLFGIEIEKHDYGLISDNSLSDVERTGWIAEKKEKVDAMLALLIKNTITPMSLTSVVDDIIGNICI